MSTRGTYKIVEDFKGKRKINYFYIQFDNNPEGAADYLQNVLNFRNSYDKSTVDNKTWSSMFEIGIPDCEQVEDHEECYADTLFRYNIYFVEQPYIRASRLFVEDLNIEHPFELPPVTWTEFYEGTLEDFIKTYKKPA